MNGGGGGGGGSYMSVRDMPVDDDITIRMARISARLNEDNTAEYDFKYEIEGSPGCTPHSYYWHIIPNIPTEIIGFQAFDSTGGLESSFAEFDAGGNIKTEYKIKYREKMVPGKKVSLSFRFTTPAAVITTTSAMQTVLFYSDHLSYTVPCDSLRYELTPPKGYSFFRTSTSHLTPVIDQGGTNPHPRPIILQFGLVPPRSPVPVQVALRSTRRIDPKRATPAVAGLVSIYLGAAAGTIFDQGLVWIGAATILVVIVSLLYYFFSIRRP